MGRGAQNIDNIDVFGSQIDKITFGEKFNIVKKLYDFERATIYGSLYEDELYLVNETLGIHTSMSGWRICELKPVYEMLMVFNGYVYEKKEMLVGYKTTTNESLEEYIKKYEEEFLKWFEENIDKTKYDEELNKLAEMKKKYPSHYYELEAYKKDEVNFYLESNLKNQCVSIKSNREDGLVIITDHDLTLSNKKFNPLEMIINYMILNRRLFEDFKELNNGYVFNNKYYEAIDDVIYDISNTIEEKCLYEKFMEKGLDLDDFKEDIEMKWGAV